MKYRCPQTNRIAGFEMITRVLFRLIFDAFSRHSMCVDKQDSQKKLQIIINKRNTFDLKSN